MQLRSFGGSRCSVYAETLAVARGLTASLRSINLNCSVHLKFSPTFPSCRDAFQCRILSQFNPVTVHTPCPYADSRIWRENFRSIRFTMTEDRDCTCSDRSMFLNNSPNTSFQDLYPTVQWTALFFCTSIRPSLL